MENTKKESVSGTSLCDTETENLQSSSNSKVSNSSEDSLTKNTSTSKSDNSASRNPSSVNTHRSSDSQKKVEELDLSTSGDVASTGHAVEEIQNSLNTLTICPLPSNSVEVINTKESVLESINSDRKINLVNLNISEDAMSSSESFNLGNEGANTSTALSIPGSSKSNKNRPSNYNSSVKNVVNAKPREKSELPSKTFSVNKTRPKRMVNKSCSSLKTGFGTQRSNSTNASTPSSTMLRNRASGTGARVRYSETLKNSTSVNKDLKDFNVNAANFNCSNSEAVKFQHDDITTPSVLDGCSLNIEDQTSNEILTEQCKFDSKLPVCSLTSVDSLNMKENSSYPSNTDAENPGPLMNRTQDIPYVAQNDCLPEQNEDDRFLCGINSGSSNDIDRNMLLFSPFSSYPVSTLSEQVDNRGSVLLRTQSTERNLRYSASYEYQSARSNNMSPYLRGVENSNSTDPTRPKCLSDDHNLNMPSTHVDAESSIQSPTIHLNDGTALSSTTLHISADFTIEKSVTAHSCIGRPGSKNGIFHISADFTATNSVSHSCTDHPISNSTISNISTAQKYSVSNDSVADDVFPEYQVLNPSIVDTNPEQQVLNNLVPYTSPEQQGLNNNPSDAFSDQLVVNIFSFPVDHHNHSRVLNIAISHTFPQHPILKYTLFQDFFHTPAINSTLTHLFSELPVIYNSILPQNETPPTLVHTFPELAQHPVLHISLSQYYNLRLVLLGFSHNCSHDTVLHFTLADSCFSHPVYYNSFNPIFPPQTYPGQPILTNGNFNFFNAIPQETCGRSIVIKIFPPNTRDLYQPRIPEFISIGNFYQPLTHSSNFSCEMNINVVQQFPNQPYYLHPSLFLPQGYYVQYFPMQYNNLQYPQQAHHPLQERHNWPRQLEDADSDTDQEVDTDQGIYTDTDPEVHTDTDQEESADA